MGGARPLTIHFVPTLSVDGWAYGAGDLTVTLAPGLREIVVTGR